MPDAPHILFLASYAPSTERPRAWNILRGLARHFRLSLLAQVRTEADRARLEALRDWCSCVEAVPLSRARILANVLRYLPTPVPLRAAYFFNPAMDRAIARRLAAERHDLVHVEHMMAAPFAAALRGLPRVWDTIDSIARLQAKILRLARSPIERLVSLEELVKLRRYEPRLCRRFDCVLTSTALDREALRAPNVRLAPNGVDLQYYRPMDIAPEPDTILFYGRLSYIANADALEHFLRAIFPLVRAQRPSARLEIVGPSPPRRIARAATEHVTVVGRVEDVRPHIARARVVVCPVRFAVGTQNKILEPMAMGVPVVATPEATASMDVTDGRELLLADDPAAFAARVVDLLRDDALRALLARHGLAYVQHHHDWRHIVDDLAAFYAEFIDRQGRAAE